jgi:hypothetical protein
MGLASGGSSQSHVTQDPEYSDVVGPDPEKARVPNHEVLDVRLGTTSTESLHDAQPLLRAVQELLQDCSLARVLAQEDVGQVRSTDVRFSSHVVEISKIVRPGLSELHGAATSHRIEKLTGRGLDSCKRSEAPSSLALSDH